MHRTTVAVTRIVMTPTTHNATSLSTIVKRVRESN